jgi:hypothetical protein
MTALADVVPRRLHVFPSKMIGRQNNFSYHPTPLETRGRNATVCPENISCYHFNNFSITEMLSVYYTLQIFRQLFLTLTKKTLT